MANEGNGPRGFTLEAARPDDIDAIVALERATQFAPHWTREVYAAMARPVDGAGHLQRCLVAAKDDSGQTVGFAVAHFYLALPDSAVLESICVAPAARRTGVGSALSQSVIEWCRSLGATEIGLEVRQQSAGAIALYRCLGFIQTGVRPRYYASPQDDAVGMRLALIPSSAR